MPARQQLAAGAQDVVETDFITKIKIDKTTHTKTGADIFIGKMLERVDNEQYNKIAVLAKKNNGYWSSFSKGFLFQSEEDANKFADAVNGVDIRFRSNPITKEINTQFNKELQQQIDGTLPKGHIYKVGNPGNILLSAGIPNLPIELTFERLFNKSKQDNHPFDMRNVANLPDAIQNPIAVFDSKTQLDSKVILTELSNGEKNFIVAIKTVRGKGTSDDRILMINDIRSLYPKDTQQLVKWIEQGLLKWVDKEKTFKWLNIHQFNSGEDIQSPKGSKSVEELRSQFSPKSSKNIGTLDSATNIVQKFNNPTIEEGKMIAEVENISQTLNTPVEIIRDIEQVPASGDVTLDSQNLTGIL